MLEINGRQIETDAEGYLARLDDWNEDVALTLSNRDGLSLTEPHWQIIREIRAYFDEYATAPNLRILQKVLKEKLGDDFGDKKALFELFPYGPAKQGARYAGMPKPTGCV